MDLTETKSRAGGDLSSDVQAGDLAEEMTGFLSDFSRFQADIKQRFQQQEDRMTQLDRKNFTRVARPALSTKAGEDAPHQKAFAAYLRSGDTDWHSWLE